MAKAKVAEKLKPAKKVEPRISSKKVAEARLEAPSEELPSGEPVGDYLRQYQVRKQTKDGSPESDPQPGSKAEKMKNFLLSQIRVRMFIPQAPGFNKSVKQDVTLNGYHLQFPRNAYVDVPQQVADVLAESLQQTEVALSQNLIGGNKEKESALL